MVQEITIDELDNRSVAFESAVDATPAIDHWCSGPDWQLPVTIAFAPRAEHLLLATDDDDGFALLAKYYGEGRQPMFGGIEPLWGFGTPIVGADVQRVATEAAVVLADRPDWTTLFLAGMPLAADDPRKPDPTVTLGVAFAFSTLGQVGFAEGITRQIIDLVDGYGPWLARRSARFRRNLRQAGSRARSAGLAIEDGSNDPGLFDRLMAIEHRSWKGQEGSGITTDEMSTMYRLMIDRLQARQRLQVHIATLDGRDVGYILGGIRARRYRGLQLSYTDEAGHLSVGNLLQDHQLQLLDHHDLADRYDLGMDFDYKRRWADRPETSLTLVVNRR